MHNSRRLLLKSALACGLLASARPAWAAPGHVLRVGPGQRYTSIAAAARDTRDGDTIEIEAGEYRADVAVWPAAQLLIRAVDGRASLIADGAAAEGKAIWVLRGGAVRIENIDFSGTRVPAFNGAGIRLENGSLQAFGCRFLDNEMGILTSNRDSMEVELEGCEFSGPREVRGDVPHNLYVGAISRLQVRACYFHHANVGHLLKSRAQRNFILYNRLSDGWEAYDTWAGAFSIDSLRVTLFRGERRIFALDYTAKAVYVLYEGKNDDLAGGEVWIAEEFQTRGYADPPETGPGPKMTRKAQLALSTWYPRYTVTAINDGMNEEFDLCIAVTKDRRKYMLFGKRNYDPSNANDDFAVPLREDYSVDLSGTGVYPGASGIQLERKQEIIEPFPIRARGRWTSLRIRNDQGSCDIRAASIESDAAPLNYRRAA